MDTVTLGTATPGGGFPVYGEAFAETIAGTDSTLAVRPQHTKGSTENVPLLEAGRLDLALVQGEVAYEALAGIGRPPADLRILAAMYSTPGMFVARADSEYRATNMPGVEYIAARMRRSAGGRPMPARAS